MYMCIIPHSLKLLRDEYFVVLPKFCSKNNFLSSFQPRIASIELGWIKFSWMRFNP